MKRLGLAYNATNPEAIALHDRAAAWCRAQGLDAWSAAAADITTLRAELPTSDVLIVLGGDGTFLRAGRAVAETDVPILGINSGTIGFLSKAEPEHLDQVLAQVQAGDYEVEPRMALEATVIPAGEPGGDDAGGRGGGVPGESHIGLNEAAVVRGSQARVVRLDVSIDDIHLATYLADGLIVATPTGSTGYSFSAGGPILDPTSRNFVVTPVAAYLAGIRSMVVSPRHTVLVRVERAYDVLVSIDGREEVPLAVGDAVRISARERPVRFVEPHGAASFWDLLRRKVELLPR
ncbi:MAG: NAD(+)/NADH kinase [Candidatus Limnocylindrales bacterium]